jgi:glycosyltransferase involved in cell wall biosynthesis
MDTYIVNKNLLEVTKNEILKLLSMKNIKFVKYILLGRILIENKFFFIIKICYFKLFYRSHLLTVNSIKKFLLNIDPLKSFFFKKNTNYNKNYLLLVSGSLGAGGAERQVVALFNSLQHIDRIDKNLLCMKLRDPNEDFFLKDVKKFISNIYELNFNSYFHQSVLYADLINSIRQFLKPLPLYFSTNFLNFLLFFLDLKPSIVHIWQDIPEAALAAYILHIKKIVISFRALPTYKTYEDLDARIIIHNFLIQNCNYIIYTANSKSVAKEYSSLLKIPYEKIRLLNNGYDESKWPLVSELHRIAAKKKLGFNADILVIGGIQRMVVEKNPSRWIYTAYLLSNRFNFIRFILYGDGPLFELSKQLVKDLQMQNILLLPGMTTNTQEALACMDIFMLSSDFEGMPNVCIEAQLSGIPVITTPAGGAPETIIHGKTGFASSSFGTLDLYKQAEKAILDMPWRLRSASLSRSHAVSCFNLDTLRRHLEDIYDC